MNLKEKIEAHNFYTGERVPYTFSVTEVCDNEPLKGYLSRKFEPKSEKVSQATLGNIFDVGMRQLVMDDVFGNTVKGGVRILKQLPNGMFLSGEPDIIDEENKVIYDVKLTKIYAYKKIIEDGVSHQYVKQLNYYNSLLGGGYDLKLFLALKDQSDVKPNDPEAIEILDVPFIKHDELIRVACEYGENVMAILEEKIGAPKKCSDTWGNSMRCRHFCAYNHVCPYGKKYYSKFSTWGV